MVECFDGSPVTDLEHESKYESDNGDIQMIRKGQ